MGELKAVRTIARERVEDLAAKESEPAWLKDLRLSAWEAYFKTPMPTARDENWHRTDISALDLSSLTTVDLAPVSDKNKLPDKTEPFDRLQKRSGAVWQSPTASACDLSEELKAKGVIFCDLRTALKDHEEKVRQYFSIPANAAQDGKFGLMVKALFNCGLFLYVPAGLEIELPFVSAISLNSDDTSISGAIFPRLLVVAGSNSKVNLIHSARSVTSGAAKEPSTCLHAGLAEIHAQPGAKVTFLDMQSLASSDYSVTRVVSAVEKDAQLTSLTVALGGKLTKGDIVSVLSGKGATNQVLGVVLGQGNEHYNFDTIEEHDAPDTKSNIVFRTALSDSATSIYQGIIRVAKAAQRTDAYQQNKNLLLGMEAKADSIPKLEILADDVKCSHGATVGPVDREQIFYLMSRGLKQVEAEELIVLGFFNKVLERFDQPDAVAWVQENISRRVFHEQPAFKTGSVSK
jgi:Fe-S cluster assembly protein SufD